MVNVLDSAVHKISIHILSRRMTLYWLILNNFKEISIHILSRRMTGTVTRWPHHPVISIHILSRRMTLYTGFSLLTTNDFNPHPLTEDDQSN